MAALLIQAAYNIVDSFFIARYTQEGLTALSVISPLQLLMTALATGTGVGANTLVSRAYGSSQTDQIKDLVKTGMLLGVINYMIFATFGWLILWPFFYISSDTASVVDQGVRYGRLNILCSLDPILIFGFGGIPAMGITGAAIATITGQTAVPAVFCSQSSFRSCCWFRWHGCSDSSD